MRHHGQQTTPIDAYTALVDELTRVCEAACHGDLEQRVGVTVDSNAHPEIEHLRQRFNHFLDVVDAFVRESAASLESAAKGSFHREFLENGMPGVFRTGASTINDSRRAMEAGVSAAAQAEARRSLLADEFEERVVQLVDELAGSSAGVNDASERLGRAAGDVASEVDRARDTIGDLAGASDEIQSVAGLIDHIAAQTKLLALNATIEAARVGEAGRGFAVVADEVKNLASQTSDATRRVAEQVEAISSRSNEAVEVISGVGDTVAAMQETVSSMATSIDGTGGEDGLVGASDHLRDEVRGFLGDIRG